MSSDGGARTRLTALPGGHSFVPSPDDRWFADVYSYTNKPPELYVAGDAPGRSGEEADVVASARVLGISVAGHADRHVPGARWRRWFGRDVYKPANYRKGGPAVLFVHGAGYLQNVDHYLVRTTRASTCSINC